MHECYYKREQQVPSCAKAQTYNTNNKSNVMTIMPFNWHIEVKANFSPLKIVYRNSKNDI